MRFWIKNDDVAPYLRVAADILPPAADLTRLIQLSAPGIFWTLRQRLSDGTPALLSAPGDPLLSIQAADLWMAPSQVAVGARRSGSDWPSVPELSAGRCGYNAVLNALANAVGGEVFSGF
jgi:hypothetical protein